MFLISFLNTSFNMVPTFFQWSNSWSFPGFSRLEIAKFKVFSMFLTMHYEVFRNSWRSIRARNKDFLSVASWLVGFLIWQPALISCSQLATQIFNLVAKISRISETWCSITISRIWCNGVYYYQCFQNYVNFSVWNFQGKLCQ